MHLDVSLRLDGTLDPDQATISLFLRDGAHLLSEHVTSERLLNIEPEGWCEYPQARLVLLDARGGLFDVAQVPGVVGRALDLAVRVETPLGTASVETQIELYRGAGL